MSLPGLPTKCRWGWPGLAAWMAVAVAVTSPALAMSPEVERLQESWAEVKYRTPKDLQEQRLASLAKEAQQLAAKTPADPEAWIWYGIIEGTYAGVKGGFSALGIVRNAKDALEKAIEIDPAAMDGSALTSLGALYYQTPGWPLGFGDDKKAIEFLRKGLVVSPDGIDANFFYGDFLYRSGDLLGSEIALRKALKAPPRPGRALADEGRAGEIEELLRKIAAKRR